MATKMIDVDNIEDGDILAKDIVMNNGTLVMPIGTALKTVYINRLKENGIITVFIKQNISDISIDDAIEKKIQEQCRESVMKTIEKYSYFGNVELQEISKVAEDIIEEVLNEPEVMYNVSQVREKSESTYSHSINVSALSVLIGLKMKLGKKKIHDLAVGSLLHDIGTVYLKNDYNQIRYEDLTEEQCKDIKRHVIIGYSVVENEKWLSQTAKDIILSHHERGDNSGYPMHKDAKHIKLEVKIVSVCDVFDSYVYGNLAVKMKVHEVMDYIISKAGKEFDYNVVNAFVSSVAAYPIGTYVLTSTNEIGVVVRQNNKMPTRPVLKLLKDAQGIEYSNPIEKDLVKELTLFIRDTI